MKSSIHIIAQIRALESYIYNYELQCRKKNITPNLSKHTLEINKITDEIRKEIIALSKK